jgi:hypothetical protein
MNRFQASSLAPWTGLFVGAAAWFADHQLSSDANYWSCDRAAGPFAIVVGLVCLAVAAAGGAASWAARPPEAAKDAETRSFARFVGAGAAGVFALAIIFGTWAGALLPACQR